MWLLAPGIRVCPVPNTGLMDEPTNAYLLGSNPVVIVDPGSRAGVDFLLAEISAAGAPTVRDIVLTHAHPDHAGGADALRAATGADIWLHPDAREEARSSGLEIPVDRDLIGGALLTIDGLVFQAAETPGHAAGHVALVEQATGVTLAGDLVSGHGTVAVVPPFGDMRAYLRSLDDLRTRGVTRLLPGHGPALDDGPAVLERYREHRLAREREILGLVRSGVAAVDEIVDRLYPDIDPRLRFSAVGTVTAHLEKLIAEGPARRDRTSEGTRYRAGHDR